MMPPNLISWLLFLAFVGAMIALDLGLLRGAPDVTGGRLIGWLLAFVIVFIAPLRIAVGPHALGVIGRNGGGRPVVAIGADIGIHIEVVEQDEIMRQLMQIRRHLFAKHDQRGIAIAFLHIAQHLIVGAILFHDVQHMFNGSTGPHGAAFGYSRVIEHLVAIRGIGQHFRCV